MRLQVQSREYLGRKGSVSVETRTMDPVITKPTRYHGAICSILQKTSAAADADEASHAQGDPCSGVPWCYDCTLLQPPLPAPPTTQVATHFHLPCRQPEESGLVNSRRSPKARWGGRPDPYADPLDMTRLESGTSLLCTEFKCSNHELQQSRDTEQAARGIVQMRTPGGY